MGAVQHKAVEGGRTVNNMGEKRGMVFMKLSVHRPVCSAESGLHHGVCVCALLA